MDFSTIATKNDVPVVIADKNGTITAINKIFTESYGWTENDLVGKSIAEIIPEELRDAHHMGISKAMSTGQSSLANQYLDLEILYKDGRRAIAPHYITVGEIDGEASLAAIIHPPK